MAVTQYIDAICYYCAELNSHALFIPLQPCHSISLDYSFNLSNVCGVVNNLFHLGRHMLQAVQYRMFRSKAFAS